MKTPVVLVAGGTGGHINAAISIGEAFSEKGYAPFYITGQRELDYKLLRNYGPLHLPSTTVRSKSLLNLVKSLIYNFYSFYLCIMRFSRTRPKVIIGAGGYVCGPTLLAGFVLGIPLFIVEQNSISGLTNKILSYISYGIFTHFSKTWGLPTIAQNKIEVVGNPVRSSIIRTYHKRSSDLRHILFFGGSLGADEINSMVKWIAETSSDSLYIRHQTGERREISISPNPRHKYEAFPYLDPIDDFYDWADVIIARSGASTVAELRYVKKPTILIPFPHATDDHQYFNAIQLRDEVDFPVLALRSGKDLTEEVFKQFLIKADLYYASSFRGDLQKEEITATDKIFRHIENNV